MKNVTLAAAGYLTLGLGLVVTGGWFLAFPSLIQVHPTFVPMQFNTALGFLLIGVALLGMAINNRRVPPIASTALFVLASVSLGQYFAGVNTGLDELLFQHNITVGTSHSGRMAPNSALCFIIFGLWAFALSTRVKRLDLEISWLAGSLIFVMSATAFAGYLADTEPLYGWYDLTQMAVHTAVGFLLTAVAILAALYEGKKVFLGLTFILGGIFCFDLITPLGVAAGILYVVPFVAAVQFTKGKELLLLTLLCLFLLGLGYFLSPGTAEVWKAVTNRILSVASILAVAYLAWQNQKSMESQLRAEKARRVQAERADLALKAGAMGTWVWQIDGGSNFEADTGFCRLLGKNLEEFCCSLDQVLECVHPDDRGKLFQPHEHDDDQQLETEGSVRILQQDETEPRWLSFKACYALDADGKRIVQRGVAWDSTEERQKDRILEEKTVELERSNKELEQFAFVASHDLQAPARQVKDYVKLLLGQVDGMLDETSRNWAAHIIASTERMQEMIRSILVVSRIGRGTSRQSDTPAQALVEVALANLSDQVRDSGIEICYQNLPSVHVDKILGVQLMQNLIENSIKYRKHDHTRPTVTIAAKAAESYWEFSCSDNGLGFDAAHRERVFDMFQRLHNREACPGTGIGLSICRKIVESHGGSIWVNSQPGTGTTFYFTLPKAKLLTASVVNQAS